MVPPEYQRRFAQALASEKPFESLRQLAIALRDEGVLQTDVYFLFEHFQKQTPATDPLYDAIVDTMDDIHGGAWSKGDGLFPAPLTDEIIQAARRNG